MKRLLLFLILQIPVLAQTDPCLKSVRLNVFNIWPQENRTLLHASGYTRGSGNLNNYNYKTFRLDAGSNVELYRLRVAAILSAQASGKFVFLRHDDSTGNEYPIIELVIGSDPYMFDCPSFP